MCGSIRLSVSYPGRSVLQGKPATPLMPVFRAGQASADWSRIMLPYAFPFPAKWCMWVDHGVLGGSHVLSIPVEISFSLDAGRKRL